ncbi:MAG: quinohemoprotein amine dehydrogenase subunit alpha [Gemmatimonadetes bacterium]|nr:quinohemoprotein amine dehydrogenase subunit alpha [Gemmatimonadota bacterium]MBK6845298.1 quinohemoprotein amine dehydrogenase subunit alpha [Gemmatimonadota bacterium]MBK7833060.1 quinohemoprotein amine dehydrogenase subunit alpha [Gemmatimonadota bacterium]MBK9407696.1 quinohemoprotein amine dehydrogenase subunit alpha [Gemmatimonadota bacterium]
MALGSFLTRVAGVASALAAVAPLAHAQPQRPQADTGGFVISDPLVVSKCQKCHARDSTGHMGRLSYLRKTPEGWEASVRRMASLADVKLQPTDARAIVKYLANKQGLAPAEVRDARFEMERRFMDFRYTGDAVTERTCRACHSVGRVMLQRRTKTEWELLIATHRGYYPNSDFQAFRRSGPSSDSAPAPHPMDQAIGHLSKAFPLQTPEWTAWSATMRPAPMEGSWLLSGYEVGRGALFGRLTVRKVPGTDDEFTSRAVYRFASGGDPVVREGKSVVYTGHQWRGRSAAPGTSADSSWREVMSVEPGWQEMSGRWFRGGYDEFGIDISAQRISGGTVVAGVVPKALKRGARDVELTVFGANLPRSVSTGTIDFGPGITATRVVRSSPDEIVVRVNVDSAARVGNRDLVVGGASLKEAVVAYDKVDRIRVSPNSNMARVGGVRFPKQFAQFEALGISYGPDGKPDTADDISVGTVPVTWSLEEYGVTFKDDDVRWVGSLDQRGVFTPAVDGPNPDRAGSRNNIGDVYVVATYQLPGGARPIKARSLLIVTVPLYMRWEPARTAP